MSEKIDFSNPLELVIDGEVAATSKESLHVETVKPPTSDRMVFEGWAVMNGDMLHISDMRPLIAESEAMANYWLDNLAWGRNRAKSFRVARVRVVEVIE